MTPHVKTIPTRTADPELTGLDFGDDEVLRYQRPELPPLSEVARYYALSEDARFYSNGGPCHQLLARRLAERVGRVTCVPVSNCTLGLVAALRQQCGSPRRQRSLIVVPSLTFTASACAIVMAGYEPLFVDVEADSWQMSPDALEDALTTHRGRIAGVMGASTFGTAAPRHVRDRWRSACAAHDVHLVIDSAAGFGATDEDERPLGAQGETEVFSFHATKPFAIGEGGAVTTPDPELGASLTRFINFGLDAATHTSVIPGINAKMSELHAATALATLDRFDAVLARRRETAAGLQAVLASTGLTYQRGCEGSTWQVLPLLVPSTVERGQVLEVAATRRIEVRPGFDPPLHRHPAFAAAPVHGTLSVTEHLAARMVCLPMANSLGPRQVARLVKLIDEALGR